MNILHVYPKYPDTFWSFRHALKFVSKKASFPPLGLLTVAAMLPSDWSQKLVDLNVRSLVEKDLCWADLVFISAMSIQRESAREIIRRAQALNKKTVVGGPLFTSHADEFDDVTHLVLNEAELTLPEFLSDLSSGTAKHLYRSDRWTDVTTTPIPMWGLVERGRYGSMNIQYSRGCPYDCEFCDITVLCGRIPRTKTAEQVIAELEALYKIRWRGGVFFVDDNFIGNRQKLKKDILPAIIKWMEARKYPFHLSTEASINLVDDEELTQLMVRAGFDTVFVGIESPNEESLIECKKTPNKNRDLVSSVKKLHTSGLQVQGGFIVGFDNDPPSIFDRIVSFIQDTNIVTAMVGLLNAPTGSRLYQRLLKEGRLIGSMTGNNTDFSINFKPIMDYEALIAGYRKILSEIYSPQQYYARVKRFLREYQPKQSKMFRLRFVHIAALLKSTVVLGIVGRGRIQYWNLFFWSLATRPRLFPLAITFSIYGFHFRKVFEQCLR